MRPGVGGFNLDGGLVFAGGEGSNTRGAGGACGLPCLKACLGEWLVETIGWMRV